MELHPFIVHFPIALISLLYIFQVFTVLIPNFTPKYLNMWVLIPATLSTIPAMISGQKTEKLLDNLCPKAIEALHYHKIFANITVWGMIVLTFFWVFFTLISGFFFFFSQLPALDILADCQAKNC